jgi:hypothetical protein
MAAARAFGVEGVDGAALEGLHRVLDEAGFVQRVGVDHHLHVVLVGDGEAVVDRGRRRAPVLVQLQRSRRRPRSSRPAAGQRGVALAGEAEVHREGIEAWIMRSMCQAPGVQVVASVPCAGPVPPPSMVVTPLISASSICCGQMKWMWRRCRRR